MTDETMTPNESLDAIELYDLHDHQESASISDALLHAIVEALDEQDEEAVQNLIAPMHAADVAELLALLTTDQRRQCMLFLRETLDPDVLTDISQDLLEEVIEALGAQKSADAIAQLDTDDALYVIETLEAPAQDEILEAITDKEYRSELREGLSFPDDSAGRLMQTDFVSVPLFWTVGDTIDHLRSAEDLPSDFYTVSVMDPRFKPVGTVMLSRIMQHKREVTIQSIMNDELRTIPVLMDQEEVARVFSKYALVEAPVVNEEGRQVGTITVDDIVDVIHEETEEDFMRAGGVSAQDLHADVLDTVKLRMPWLLINLLTAIAASAVVSYFDSTIEKVVALAVLMPIVASMSGNAGIQTVTVAVRALATKEVKRSNVWWMLRKELAVGMLNGVVLALVTLVLVMIYYNDMRLAAIFSGSIFVALVLAGMSGFLTPLMLEKLNIDPASAAGVCLTTFTDVSSFFVFLGLATWLL